MTGYVGRSFTLKRGTGGGATLITQCRALSFTMTHQGVEITNKDSSGFQTFLEGAGSKGIQIQFEGIYDNSAAFESFLADLQTGTIASYRMEFGDTDIIEASFRPASWGISGDHDNAQLFTASLESSGTITFTNG